MNFPLRLEIENFGCAFIIKLICSRSPLNSTWTLLIGKKNNNIGFLIFTAHPDFQVPASIMVSVRNKKWFVSLNYQNPNCELKTQKELIADLAHCARDELMDKTIGLDLGVIIPVQASTGESFDLTSEQKISNIILLTKHLNRLLEKNKHLSILEFRIIVMDDLKIKNRTKSPEPRPNPHRLGHYLLSGSP